jgi:hypothetical protein
VATGREEGEEAMSEPMMSAATDALARGWSVVHVDTSPYAKGGGKAPVGEWDEFQIRYATPEEAETWFGNGHKNIGIGVVCGRISRLLVVDVDLYKLGGIKSLARLALLGVDPERTYSVATPSGGLHVYYELEDGESLPSVRDRETYPDVEFQGEGAQVLAPPTERAGGMYEPISLETVAPVPRRLREYLNNHKAPKGKAVSTAVVLAKSRDHWRNGNGCGYALAAVEAEVSELATMGVDTGRNDKLNHASYYLHQLVAGGCLSAEYVSERLYGACELNGYIQTDGEQAFKATFESGRVAGLLEPRACGDGATAQHLPEATTRTSTRAGRLTLITAQDVQPERLRFLWDGRIPLGCVTILGGKPDQGKSQVALDRAAALSRGDLEGELFGTPAGTIVAMIEDPMAAGTVPRLIAARADLKRVDLIDFKDSVLDLAEDLGALRDAIETKRPKLVILDPINSYLGRTINANSDQHIRSVLGPLAQLAEEFDCAVLVIMHMRKGASSDAFDSLLGSVGYGGAARAIMVVGSDPDDTGDAEYAHILATGKANLSRKAPALRYRTVPAHVLTPNDPLGASTSRIEWTGEAEGWTAGQIVRGFEEPGQLESAEDFLETELAGGARKARDVEDAARKASISGRTLRRAREKLGVRTSKPVNPGPNYWELPKVAEAARDGAGGFEIGQVLP